jgi:hypothetical protein
VDSRLRGRALSLDVSEWGISLCVIRPGGYSPLLGLVTGLQEGNKTSPGVVDVWVVEGRTVQVYADVVFLYVRHTWVTIVQTLLRACIACQARQGLGDVGALDDVTTEQLAYQTSGTVCVPATRDSLVVPQLLPVLTETRLAYNEARVRGSLLVKGLLEETARVHGGELPQAVGPRLRYLIQRCFAYANPSADASSGGGSELPEEVRGAWAVATTHLNLAHPRPWRAPNFSIAPALAVAADTLFYTNLATMCGEDLRALTLNFMTSTFPLAKERVEKLLDAPVVVDTMRTALDTDMEKRGYPAAGSGDWAASSIVLQYHAARSERARAKREFQVTSGQATAASLAGSGSGGGAASSGGAGSGGAGSGGSGGRDGAYVPDSDTDDDDDELFDQCVSDEEEGGPTQRQTRDARIGTQVLHSINLRAYLIARGQRLSGGDIPALVPLARVSKGALALQCKDVLPALRACAAYAHRQAETTTDARAQQQGRTHLGTIDALLAVCAGRATAPLELLFGDPGSRRGVAPVVKRYGGVGGRVLFTGGGWRLRHSKVVLYRLTRNDKLNRNVDWRQPRTLRAVPGQPLSGGRKGGDQFMRQVFGEYAQGDIPRHDEKAHGWRHVCLDLGDNVTGCSVSSFLLPGDFQACVRGARPHLSDPVKHALSQLGETTARSPDMIKSQDYATRLGTVWCAGPAGTGVGWRLAYGVCCAACVCVCNMRVRVRVCVCVCVWA